MRNKTGKHLKNRIKWISRTDLIRGEITLNVPSHLRMKVGEVKLYHSDRINYALLGASIDINQVPMAFGRLYNATYTDNRKSS